MPIFESVVDSTIIAIRSRRFNVAGGPTDRAAKLQEGTRPSLTQAAAPDRTDPSDRARRPAACEAAQTRRPEKRLRVFIPPSMLSNCRTPCATNGPAAHPAPAEPVPARKLKQPPTLFENTRQERGRSQRRTPMIRVVKRSSRAHYPSDRHGHRGVRAGSTGLDRRQARRAYEPCVLRRVEP